MGKLSIPQKRALISINYYCAIIQTIDIPSYNECVVLSNLYELKKCVKNDTFYIKIFFDDFSSE